MSGACPHAELPAEPSPVLVSAFHLSRLQQAALCLPSWKQNLIQGHMSACHPSFPFRACAKVMRQAPRRSTMSTWRLSRVRFLPRSEEHTSELQSLMRISYDVFCWK